MEKSRGGKKGGGLKKKDYDRVMEGTAGCLDSIKVTSWKQGSNQHGNAIVKLREIGRWESAARKRGKKRNTEHLLLKSLLAESRQSGEG